MDEYLLVDGYNIIFAWRDLGELAQINLDAARVKLQEILSNYQGFKKNVVIVVYDGYKRKENPGNIYQYQNIHVVFTKEAETADQYIEKTVHTLVTENKVRVATSDRLEQMIIMGQGAMRVSAKQLLEEIEDVNRIIRQEHLKGKPGGKNYLIDNLTPEMADFIAKLRLTETD